MNTKQRIGLCILFILFSSIFVSAVQPSTQISITQEPPALTIVYPKETFYWYSDANLSMHFLVLDSNYSKVDNTTTQCSYAIHDKEGNHVAVGDLLYCNIHKAYHFEVPSANISKAATYSYYVYCNNSDEAGFVSDSMIISSSERIKTEAGSAPLVLIMLIPLIIAVFFLIYSITLGDEHTALKIALFLGSFMPFFASLHIGITILIKYYDFEILENIVADTTYWFALLVAALFFYVLIYIFYVAISMAAEKKKERLKY